MSLLFVHRQPEVQHPTISWLQVVLVGSGLAVLGLARYACTPSEVAPSSPRDYGRTYLKMMKGVYTAMSKRGHSR